MTRRVLLCAVLLLGVAVSAQAQELSLFGAVEFAADPYRAREDRLLRMVGVQAQVHVLDTSLLDVLLGGMLFGDLAGVIGGGPVASVRYRLAPWFEPELDLGILFASEPYPAPETGHGTFLVRLGPRIRLTERFSLVPHLYHLSNGGILGSRNQDSNGIGTAISWAW